MGMKAGLVVGFAVGYVLGARAGRERYEQLRASWGQVSRSPAMQRATDGAKSLAGEAGRRGLGAVQGGVTKVTGAVRTRLGEDATAPDYAVGT